MFENNDNMISHGLFDLSKGYPKSEPVSAKQNTTKKPVSGKTEKKIEPVKSIDIEINVFKTRLHLALYILDKTKCLTQAEVPNLQDHLLKYVNGKRNRLLHVLALISDDDLKERLTTAVNLDKSVQVKTKTLSVPSYFLKWLDYEYRLL